MKSPSYVTYDRKDTAKLLSFATLVDAIAHAAEEYATDGILSPERLVMRARKSWSSASVTSSRIWRKSALIRWQEARSL